MIFSIGLICFLQCDCAVAKVPAMQTESANTVNLASFLIPHIFLVPHGPLFILCSVIAQLQKYQQLPYCLELYKPLHRALVELKTPMDEQALYARSIAIEKQQC